jgi:hypothetical protein
MRAKRSSYEWHAAPTSHCELPDEGCPHVPDDDAVAGGVGEVGVGLRRPGGAADVHAAIAIAITRTLNAFDDRPRPVTGRPIPREE